MEAVRREVQELRPRWANFASRLQSSLHRNQGYALVTITFLVDESNNPVVWGTPDVSKIEPAMSAGDTLMKLAKKLCQVD
jgi:hypothetical protein